MREGETFVFVSKITVTFDVGSTCLSSTFQFCLRHFLLMIRKKFIREMFFLNLRINITRYQS